MAHRTSRGRITLAEERPRSGRRRTVVTALLVALAAGLVFAAYIGVRGVVSNFGGPKCRATALGQSVTFDPDQMNHAATIVAIASKRGLPARAATIAVATAIQESKLRNVQYGDRDSLGLFQQRPSMGWGTREQILNPEYAANAFYDALVKVKGYQSMNITEVAQKVQKSGYPQAYAQHEQEGRIIASAIYGHSPAGLGCRLDPATAAATEPALQKALQNELGLAGKRSGRSLQVGSGSSREAWGAAAWAVAKADAMGVTKVSVDGKQWTRTRDSSGWSWQTASSKVGATTVSIELR